MINNRCLPSVVNNDNEILVTIIVVNRNGLNHLKTLLPALIKYTDDIKYEFILVDNASVDKSVEFTEKILKTSDQKIPLQIIKNKVNESFSVANNKAVNIAKGKYIVLLNNDIEPLYGWLHYLLQIAESTPNIGSVGSRLIYPNIKSSNFKNLFKKKINENYKIQHAGIGFKNEGKLFRPYNLGKNKIFNDSSVVSNENKIALTAACLLVPKVIYLEVGGLDEFYNYGGEDVDFGLKLIKAGYRNFYCSDSVLFHHEFGTQSLEKKKHGAERRRVNLQYFQSKWYLSIKKAFWEEKITGKSAVYTSTPLVILIVDLNEEEIKEIFSVLKSFDWTIIFVTTKEFKHKKNTIYYDFVLSKNSSETMLIKNNRIVREIKNTTDLESFREYLVRFYLMPSIVIKIAAKTWEGTYSWGDYHMAVLLKQQLENLGHIVLIQIYPEWDNDEGLEYDVVIVMRGVSKYKAKPHQINIMWNISHPNDVSLEEYDSYDQVFIASSFWSEEISKQISVPVKKMLQCTDPERFKEPTEEEKFKYHQQLLFVGNSRGVYRKILKDILPTKYNLAVYGRSWKKILPKNIIKGEHIHNDQLYKHYGAADILLNDHWDDMREKGFVSNRIFDGLACGALLLTDRVTEMGELENYVQVYDTREELSNLIDHKLSNKHQYQKKIQDGKRYVIENHTFEHRARVFSLTIKQLLKTRLSRKGYDNS